MRFRKEREESIIQEELSKIIFKEVDFPGALVTVTGVRLSRELDRVTVKMSTIPDLKSADVLRVLSGRARYLEILLDDKLHLRPMPQIVFEIDRTGELEQKIEKIVVEDRMGE